MEPGTGQRFNEGDAPRRRRFLLTLLRQSAEGGGVHRVEGEARRHVQTRWRSQSQRALSPEAALSSGVRAGTAEQALRRLYACGCLRTPAVRLR